MTFKVQVNNVHLPRLAKRLGYTGDPNDPAAFKAFVEGLIIKEWKRLVKDEIRREEIEKISISFNETDIAPEV